MKLKTAEWIWTRQNYGADEYAEFKTSFDYVEGDKVEIAIASDSILTESLLLSVNMRIIPIIRFTMN